jgi:non-ribosomal peptide synthetase component F
MTETSPASFMSSVTDPLEKKLLTVGKIMPHTSAKIVDSSGNIVPVGARGELCVSGYLRQKRYFKNPRKSNEVMIADKNGIVWMHTGDEAMFDTEGYCQITGRIKDIIIRGKVSPMKFRRNADLRQVERTSIPSRSKSGLMSIQQFRNAVLLELMTNVMERPWQPFCRHGRG